MACCWSCRLAGGVADFVIAGAMKSGTTYLDFAVLRSNPAVRLSPHEIHYLEDCAPFERGRACHTHAPPRPTGPWIWEGNGSLVGEYHDDDFDEMDRDWRAWMPEGHNETRNYLWPDNPDDDNDRNCTAQGWDALLPERTGPGLLIGDKTPIYMALPNVSCCPTSQPTNRPTDHSDTNTQTGRQADFFLPMG
jgi:hypothetical protein